MAFIIWLIGTILAIKAVLEVCTMNISTAWKLIWSILLLVTGWIGLAVYYFFAKDKIEGWSK
jgi:hypothetical protein